MNSLHGSDSRHTRVDGGSEKKTNNYNRDNERLIIHFKNLRLKLNPKGLVIIMA